MTNPFEELDKRLSAIESILHEISTREPIVQVKQDEPDPEQLLTKKEAAKLLKCSTSTIDNYRRAGVLVFTKLGRSVKFRREDILALAKPAR